MQRKYVRSLNRILPVLALLSLSMARSGAFNINKVIAPPKRTEAQLDREIQLHPNSADPYCDRADSYVCAGESEAALRDYDRALKLNPHSARVLLGKSVALDSIGNLDEALKYADLAIKQNDKTVTASAIMHKINLLIELKREKETVPEYLRLIECTDLGVKAGDKKTLYMHLGDMYLSLKEPDKAIQMFAKGVEGQSFLPPKFHSQRARAYCELGKNKEAVADYSKAIEQLNVKLKTGMNFEALLLSCYRERAALYEKMGKKQLADADKRAVAKLDKDAFGRSPFMK